MTAFTVRRHGPRCWLFGHNVNSRCLPLTDRAVIALVDATEVSGSSLVVAADELVARALGISVPAARALIIELRERRLIAWPSDL